MLPGNSNVSIISIDSKHSTCFPLPSGPHWEFHGIYSGIYGDYLPSIKKPLAVQGGWSCLTKHCQAEILEPKYSTRVTPDSIELGIEETNFSSSCQFHMCSFISLFLPISASMYKFFISRQKYKKMYYFLTFPPHTQNMHFTQKRQSSICIFNWKHTFLYIF